jgi:hypothetical protein
MENRPRQYRPESEKPKSTDPPKPKQENRERQPLPSVWDILEHRVRLHDMVVRDVRDRPRGQAYQREQRALNQLEGEIHERGTARDNLIMRLHDAITVQPSGRLPVPIRIRELSPEEFQQFRSRVDPMSEEEIREEIRKAEDEYDRKAEEIDKRQSGAPRLPGMGMP